MQGCSRLFALCLIGAVAACGSSNNSDAAEAAASKKEAEPSPAAKSPTEKAPPGAAEGSEGEQSTIEVRSSAFEHQGAIPKRHTCQGGDVSVPLSWSGVPDGTESFALIVDDPDAPDPKAPKTVWVHWVLYDIPADVRELPAGVEELPAGTREGENDWDRTGWGGPCPPVGRHRYFHKLYALDSKLEDLGRPTKDELLEAMAGHVLAEGELIGTYEKE